MHLVTEWQTVITSYQFVFKAVRSGFSLAFRVNWKEHFLYSKGDKSVLVLSIIQTQFVSP